MADDPSSRVMLWWTLLSTIAVANAVAWAVVAGGVVRSRDREGSAGWPARRRQLVLSALFVAGCAFRSFFPRAEAQRIVLLDSWLSNAWLGRAVATVAELSLVAQWSLVLREAAAPARTTFASIVSRLLVPLIAMAEIASWYTALTTNFIGSVIEESLWAVSASLLVLGFLSVIPRHHGARRLFIAVAVAFNVVYVAFMTNVDVPMYWSRWQRDQQEHKTYIPVGRGMVDSWIRRVPTRRFDDWRDEMPW